MDWIEKAESLADNLDLQMKFTETEEFFEAFISWHQKNYPEEWGND